MLPAALLHRGALNFPRSPDVHSRSYRRSPTGTPTGEPAPAATNKRPRALIQPKRNLPACPSLPQARLRLPATSLQPSSRCSILAWPHVDPCGSTCRAGEKAAARETHLSVLWPADSPSLLPTTPGTPIDSDLDLTAQRKREIGARLTIPTTALGRCQPSSRFGPIAAGSLHSPPPLLRHAPPRPHSGSSTGAKPL